MVVKVTAMRDKLFKTVTAILVLVFAFGLAACSTDPQESSPTGSTSVARTQNEEHTGRRVYFAAPLFSESEREYNLHIVNILESYGYEVFLPQRDGFLAPELEGLTEEEKIQKIFEKDKEEVLNSDILFMVLDGRIPDEGACVELGIAYANGIRCYGYKSDARSVELDMDLNPMITGCLIHLFYNLNGEQLEAELEEYLQNNTL